jgi:putative transposase
MSRETSPASGRPYGLARVARVWGVSRATLYRHRHVSPAAPRRSGPIGPMPDDDLVAAIRRVLTASPFHGEGYPRCGPGCALPAFAPRAGGCCD